MGQRGIEQLTEGQRACLRLVYSHHNSKEIAARTGVSPSAIDKRIERAVQILQVQTRFEAARALHDHEAASGPAADPASERLPSEPIDVPPDRAEPSIVTQHEPWGFVSRFLGLVPRDGIEGTARVRTTRIERLVRLVVLAVMIAIVSVALVNLMTTVTSLLRTNRPASIPRGAGHVERR